MRFISINAAKSGNNKNGHRDPTAAALRNTLNSKPQITPYPSTLKAETSLVNSAACCFKLSAAAALSSTNAAFCCVI